MLRVDRKIDFMESVRAIRVFESWDKVQPGFRAIISGWGDTKEKKVNNTDVLGHADAPLMSNEDCNKLYCHKIQNKLF